MREALARVHGACRRFSAEPLSWVCQALSRVAGDTEVVGRGSFWKTGTNASHPKHAAFTPSCCLR